VVTLFAAVLGTVLAALILAAILVLPTVRTVAASGTADGSRAYGVGSGYEMPTEGAFAIVKPETGWTVQPDRSGSGLVVLSPDRVLSVHLEPTPSGEAEKTLDAVGGPPLAETLASGLDLRHASSGQVFVGVVEHEPTGGNDRALLVEAEVAAGVDPERYRPALAGLLESITIE
jgi:hypothetical protein